MIALIYHTVEGSSSVATQEMTSEVTAHKFWTASSTSQQQSTQTTNTIPTLKLASTSKPIKSVVSTSAIRTVSTTLPSSSSVTTGNSLLLDMLIHIIDQINLKLKTKFIYHLYICEV